VADVQRAIVEPDVGFNGDAANRYSGVYRNVTPVVIV
jgi:hypothetical protein